MILNIKNFEKALEGAQFDKWHLFDIIDGKNGYEFRARNMPHSQKDHPACDAVLVTIRKWPDENNTYSVTIDYRTYSNTIYSKRHTKAEIANKDSFFNILLNAINEHENR